MNINNVNKQVSGVTPKSNDKSNSRSYRIDSASASPQSHVGDKGDVENSKAAQILKQIPEVRPEVIANATQLLESGQLLSKEAAVKTAEAILGY